jgi:rare lipoprotein A
MPLPSYARVTNLANHRSIVVRVNDRGPYVGNRVIDLSVRAAKLLHFYGDGVTKVKVDYVGRAPLEGSDDRTLEATLREGVPGSAPPVLVASNKTYAPTFFDSRPMTQARVPAPPDRPYRLGEGAREVPAVRAQTVELAATTHPHAGPAYAEATAPEPQASPVSAYAPVGYDGRAGLLSGRGLY